MNNKSNKFSKAKKKKLVYTIVTFIIFALVGTSLVTNSLPKPVKDVIYSITKINVDKVAKDFDNIIPKNGRGTQPSAKGEQPTFTGNIVEYTIEQGNKGVLTFEVNNNIPSFTNEELDLNSSYHKGKREEFIKRQEELEWFELNEDGFKKDVYTWEQFSELDKLNRVSTAQALISNKVAPTEDRAPRLKVSPTGWKQQKINDATVFDRSHLIGYQFTGHNDEPRNLMTGTSQFNRIGMLEYERKVRDEVDKGNHVMYRVTPIFVDNELLARGVQMEAQSIEDKNFHFNIVVTNILDGTSINYETSKITPNK